MTVVVFEAAQARDKEAFLALTRLTYQEHNQRLPDEFPRVTDARIEALINRHFASGRTPNPSMFTRIIAAKAGATVVGYALILFYPIERTPDSYDLSATIYDVSLLPDYRHRGFGKQLMAHCEKVMREVGATKARAEVWRGNAASNALFRSQDWSDANTTYVRRLAEPIQGVVPKAKPPKPTFFWEAIAVVVFLLVYGLIVYL